MPIPVIAAVAGRAIAGAASRAAAGAANSAGAGGATQGAAGTAGRMGATSVGRHMAANQMSQPNEPRSKNFMEAAQMAHGPDVFSADLRPF